MIGSADIRKSTDAKTVFTETAKGLTQINQKTQSLLCQLTKDLKAIDGRSTISVSSDKVDVAIPALEKDLVELRKDGLIKVFEVSVEEPMPAFGGDDDDDVDFTALARISAALKEPVSVFGSSK
jgi:DNA-binding Lrp family transcriptional regulator